MNGDVVWLQNDRCRRIARLILVHFNSGIVMKTACMLHFNTPKAGTFPH
jgi:hypothetical protein